MLRKHIFASETVTKPAQATRLSAIQLLQSEFSHHCLKSSDGQPTKGQEASSGGAHLQLMSRQRHRRA